jgi:hypothetical protein
MLRPNCRPRGARSSPSVPGSTWPVSRRSTPLSPITPAFGRPAASATAHLAPRVTVVGAGALGGKAAYVEEGADASSVMSVAPAQSGGHVLFGAVGEGGQLVPVHGHEGAQQPLTQRRPQQRGLLQ